MDLRRTDAGSLVSRDVTDVNVHERHELISDMLRNDRELPAQRVLVKVL
jgi:hypothetical protein